MARLARWLSPLLAASAATLVPCAAHATCSWGVVGQAAGHVADVFFTPGVSATKEVTVPLYGHAIYAANTDASWGSGHCEFWAVSEVPGIQIQDTYGGWSISDAEIFQGGIGGPGYDFDEFVRMISSAPAAGSGVVRLYTDIRTSEFDPVHLREIGQINVYVGTPQPTTFTAQKVGGGSYYFYLDHPLINDEASASLIVSQNLEESSTANDHDIGVYYSPYSRRWAIVNQDGGTMPSGSVFNVRIGGIGEQSRVHVTDASNNLYWISYIDDPLTNGNPNAIVNLTPVYRASGSPGAWHNHTLGLYFDNWAQQWAIYNEDFAYMTEGRAFNYVVSGYRDNGTSGVDPIGTIGSFVPDDAMAFYTHVNNPEGGSSNLYNARVGMSLGAGGGSCAPPFWLCWNEAYPEPLAGGSVPAGITFNTALFPDPI